MIRVKLERERERERERDAARLYSIRLLRWPLVFTTPFLGLRVVSEHIIVAFLSLGLSEIESDPDDRLLCEEGISFTSMATTHKQRVYINHVFSCIPCPCAVFYPDSFREYYYAQIITFEVHLVGSEYRFSAAHFYFTITCGHTIG